MVRASDGTNHWNSERALALQILSVEERVFSPESELLVGAALLLILAVWQGPFLKPLRRCAGGAESLQLFMEVQCTLVDMEVVGLYT